MLILPVRTRVWLYRRLPPGVAERPAEWFLALLSILSGFASLFGPVAQHSLDQLLPRAIHYGWNVSLIVGGTALLVGLSSIRYLTGGYAVTHVPAYRLGCRLLGLASVVYAVSLFVVYGWHAGFSAVIVLTYAFVFVVRLLGLQGRR